MMNEQDVAVEVSNITKNFILPHQKASTLKYFFLNPFRKFDNETQKALNKISFEIKKGEFFGVVGRNGSGKSTLLKCIAGVYQPDSGHINVNGSLVPFIELGVGFNPELSGRDNVFLNASLLGFGRREIEKMYDEIVEFAELEDHMDQKLKNFSSGMQVRLAFSVAIQAKSDILLLDEVLAVGDALFQQKCFNYFNRLKQEGKTVLLVSHDSNALRQYCTRGVLVENGQIIAKSAIEEVLDKYTDLVSQKEAEDLRVPDKAAQKRMGSGKVVVESVATYDEKQKPKKVFSDDDKKIVIKAKYRAKEKAPSPIYGITVRDTLGSTVFASNNLWQAKKSQDIDTGFGQEVVWAIPNIFNTGEFNITPAVADMYGREVYDRIEEMAIFKVRKKISSSALTNPLHEISLASPK